MHKFLAGQTKRSSTQKESSQRINKAKSYAIFSDQEFVGHELIGVGGGSVKDASWNERRIGFTGMFRYATPRDITLMAMGLLLGVLTAVFRSVFVYCVGLYLKFAVAPDFNCSNSAVAIHAVLKVKGDDNNRICTITVFFLIITCVIGAVVLSFLQHFLLMFSARAQTMRLRREYFAAILRKDFSWLDCYIDRDLSHRFNHDIYEIRKGLGETLSTLISVMTSAVLVIGIAMYLDAAVAIIIICAMPLLAGLVYSKTKVEAHLLAEEQRAYEPADALAGEILTNVRAVKQYEGELTEVSRYARALSPPRYLWRPVLLVAAQAFLYWVLPAALAGLIFMLRGAQDYDVSDAEICASLTSPSWEIMREPRVLVTAVVLISTILAGADISRACFLLQIVKRAKRRAAKVFFVIDWKPRIDNLSKAGEVRGESLSGSFTFESVNFTYPRSCNKFVLSNVDLTISPGQMVALFGNHGCGKSTVLSLLFRLYDPNGGAVKADGKDIREFNVGWLRKQMSFVPQESAIFNGTLEENIRVGKVGSDFQEIVHICQTVKIHADIISLAKGYKTVVGPKSEVKFTPIQMRKVALARALLRDSPVLLIDNLAPNSDDGFEALLFNILETYRGKRTIILASSRFSTIVQNCDFVYGLKDGKVVDRGAPSDFVLKRGPGYELYQESLQFSRDFKPIFPSQLMSYKFAAAIKRKHDRADVTLQYPDDSKSTASAKTKRAGDSEPQVKLHSPISRRVTPRITAGFHGYLLPGLHEANAHYFRKVINSSLIRERDLRIKMKRNQNGNRPCSGPSVSGETSSMTHHEPGFEWEMEQTTGKNWAHKGGSAPPSVTTTSGVVETKFRVTSDFPEEEEAQLFVDFDSRLKHYFGWTVNASPGTESISSEDSNVFWNAYSLSLAKALRIQVQITFRALFGLARYSWPYLLFGAISSAAIGLNLIAQGRALSPYIHYHIGTYRKWHEHTDIYFTTPPLLSAVLAFIQELVLGFGMCQSVNAMRRSLLLGFLSRDIAWFDLPENDIGFLRDSMAADTVAVQEAFLTWTTIGGQGLTTLVSAAVLADTSPGLGLGSIGRLLSLLMVFATLVVLTLDGRNQINSPLTSERHFKEYCELVDEAITNSRTVVYLGLEEHLLEEHDKRMKESIRKLFPFQVFQTTLFSLAFSWRQILFLLLLNFSIWHSGNRFSLPFFALYFFIFLMGIYPLGASLSSLPGLGNTSTTATLIVENIGVWKLETESENDKIDVDINKDDPSRTLKLHKVSFAYPACPENMILREFTLEIQHGSFVAIVGAIQSGKSCIIDLLDSMYVPSSGAVVSEISHDDTDPLMMRKSIELFHVHFNHDNIQQLLDEWNCKGIKRKCLRKIIGIVKQDPLFLDLTIAENIAYGDLERRVAEPEIIDAAKKARIHNLIVRLPKKYETRLSTLPESPTTFVLRQRLEVARAWIRNPKIVLVDEATVSVNPANDELLEQALMKLREGRTFVVTSQRIAPIRDADTIVVLQDGGIAEMGTDDELMRKKGLYYEIFVSQELFEARYEPEGVRFHFSDSPNSSLSFHPLS